MPPAPLDLLNDDIHAAISRLEPALQSSHASLGVAHPETIALANRLAIAYWRAGQIDQALGVLDQALAEMEVSAPVEFSGRVETLCTLGQILLDQGHWEHAARALGDLWQLYVEQLGAAHPSALAVQGDLAEVLFELGRNAEAEEIESDACRGAARHLGRAHPVSSVLAWNRALRLEDAGDFESARRLMVEGLAWLLAANEEHLDADQKTIRGLLAQRFQWDEASAC